MPCQDRAGAAQPRVLVLDLDVADRQALFTAVSGRLLAESLVRPGYPQALERREQEYPTGLDLVDRAVAIPHTDDEHVAAPGLVLARTARPTVFRAMDDPERPLDVRLSLFPLMTDPRQQTDMLGAAIALLVDAEAYQDLLTGSPEEAMGRLTGLVSTLA